jgi:Mg-chelatase subunit ChlD
MRFVLAGVLFMTAAVGLTRQPRSCPHVVEGFVKDENGNALVDARVLIAGTQLGAPTDAKGYYRIRVRCEQAATASQVRFLRIGYEQASRALSLGQDSVVRIDVALKPMSVFIGVTVITIPDAEEFARRTPRYAEFRSAPAAATIGGPFDRVSFTAVRHFLKGRELPPANAFGVDGLIQHPDVGWPSRAKAADVALVVDEMPAPWAPERTLVRASLISRPSTKQRAPRNTVFVIDGSGSLWHLVPRVRQAISHATATLDERDRVSIIAFRGPRSVLLSGASGTERARIRAALDSVEDGGVNAAETNVLTLAERTAQSSARPGLETRIVLITDEGGIGHPLGSDNLIADVRRIRANGMRVDVVRLDDDAPSDRMGAIALGGGGNVLDGSRDASLHASLGRVFDVAIPLRATQPSFKLEFDGRRVARWRCLNDIGERETSSMGRKLETLYAGASVTVVCETEPRGANTAATNTRVTATYLDRIGVKHSLDADSSPDSLLRDETRLIAHAAGFGLWLANPAALGQWNADSVAAGIDDRAGYGAELRRFARVAKERRR